MKVTLIEVGGTRLQYPTEVSLKHVRKMTCPYCEEVIENSPAYYWAANTDELNYDLGRTKLSFGICCLDCGKEE